MNYLSTMLEIDKAANDLRVDSQRHAAYLGKDAQAKRLEELDKLGELISTSILSAHDKDLFLDVVEKSKASLAYDGNIGNHGLENLKYLLIALASGSAGFGLGWKAKSMYDGYKEARAEEIADMVKRKMEGGK